MLIRKTSRKIGRNPVARAVALQKLEETARTYRIALYLTQDGANLAEDVPLMLVVARAMLIGLGDERSSDVGKLKSAVKLLEELRTRPYSKDDTVTLDNMFAIVLDRYKELAPDVANSAIQQAMKVSK